MDEIGFIVTHVDEDGLSDFTSGGLRPQNVDFQRVIVTVRRPHWRDGLSTR